MVCQFVIRITTVLGALAAAAGMSVAHGQNMDCRFFKVTTTGLNAFDQPRGDSNFIVELRRSDVVCVAGDQAVGDRVWAFIPYKLLAQDQHAAVQGWAIMSSLQPATPAEVAAVHDATTAPAPATAPVAAAALAAPPSAALPGAATAAGPAPLAAAATLGAPPNVSAPGAAPSAARGAASSAASPGASGPSAPLDATVAPGTPSALAANTGASDRAIEAAPLTAPAPPSAAIAEKAAATPPAPVVAPAPSGGAALAAAADSSADPTTPANPASEIVRYAQTINSGPPPVYGHSLAQLVTGVPMFPPIDGLPENVWQKTCNNCHNWNQQSLCVQAKIYAGDPKMAFRKQHPYGGPEKLAMMNWAQNGCQ
jgi:hypothetical protein